MLLYDNYFFQDNTLDIISFFQLFCKIWHQEVLKNIPHFISRFMTVSQYQYTMLFYYGLCFSLTSLIV